MLMHRRLTSFASWQVALFLLFALSIFISGYMSIEKSNWIWDHLPFMVAVQFPWRWLSVLATFLALFIGSATLFISARAHRYFYVLFMSIVIIATTTRYFQPENFDDISQSFYYGDPERIRHD